ncbi:MAG TPA: ISKra4 family transposase, partial [Xanthomonadaceae bacterium]|nr:ISKra4 family transposase [Xanthomonadaceae bacterium]
FGALLPYRRARVLLGTFFPVGDLPTIDTIQRRTLQVGARLECEAVATPTLLPPPTDAETIALSIDSGHVRAVRSYQVRTFEVFVAQSSNDDGEQIVFSSVRVEADRQTQQLRGELHRLGATPRTDFTILSHGADGPRSLGEAASIGPTCHVLDWFHLAMRIQHVGQAVEGWPDITNGDRQNGTLFADAVEHARWRLWHGQMQRALDLIGDTVAALDAVAAVGPAARATAGEVGAFLRGLETYVAEQAAMIIDYAAARHDAEPISTAPTESTVQWLLHRRMGARQQMRWSPLGAHMMLRVRTAVANDTFERDYTVAERWARCPFRRAA